MSPFFFLTGFFLSGIFFEVVLFAIVSPPGYDGKNHLSTSSLIVDLFTVEDKWCSFEYLFGNNLGSKLFLIFFANLIAFHYQD